MKTPSVTHDTVYDGRVHLVQPSHGFRAGDDSLLLAAAVSGQSGEALDIGCGCGGALLTAAHRLPEMRLTGLDIDADMAALARAGAVKNDMDERVFVEQGEAKAWVSPFENRFDLVFSNPPYFAEGTTSPPAETRQSAYVETLPSEDWLKAMVFAAKPRAPVVLIHRAAELARILGAMNRWTGELTVLPIRPHAGKDATRILVRGRKGLKRGAVRLLAGLDLQENGDASEALQAVRRGDAIDW